MSLMLKISRIAILTTLLVTVLAISAGAAGIHHKFVNQHADGADATVVRPSNWNDDHDLYSITVNSDPTFTLTGSINPTLVETVSITGSINPTTVVSTPITGSLNPATYATVATLTGSIDPTASVNVVGVGTLFLSELQTGDRILVTGLIRTVAFVTDNTNLTVTSAFTDVANDVAPVKITAATVYVGVGTLFTSELVVGDRLKVNTTTRTITSIISDTQITVSGGTFTGANDTTLEKISPANALLGVGTLFTSELIVGDRIKVNTSVWTVATIIDNTHLTVTATSVSGANDTTPEKVTSVVGDVVGVGTNFIAEVIAGDYLSIKGEVHRITSVLSNTRLTVDIIFTGIVNDTTPLRLRNYLRLNDSSGVTQDYFNQTGQYFIGHTALGASANISPSYTVNIKDALTFIVSDYAKVQSGFNFDITANMDGVLSAPSSMTGNLTVEGGGTNMAPSGMSSTLTLGVTSTGSGAKAGWVMPSALSAGIVSRAGSTIQLQDMEAFRVLSPAWAGSYPLVRYYGIGIEDQFPTPIGQLYLPTSTETAALMFQTQGSGAPPAVGAITIKPVINSPIVWGAWLQGQRRAGSMEFGTNRSSSLWTDDTDFYIDPQNYASGGTVNILGNTVIADANSLGPNLISDGTFTAGNGTFALTTGWNWDSNGGVKHMAAGTGTVSRSTYTFTSGVISKLTFSIFNTTSAASQTVTASIFGQTFRPLSRNGIYTFYFKSTGATGTLAFTPTSGWLGSITGVQINELQSANLTAGSITLQTGGSATGSMACWKSGKVLGYCDLATECSTTCH